MYTTVFVILPKSDCNVLRVGFIRAIARKALGSINKKLRIENVQNRPFLRYNLKKNVFSNEAYI